MGGACARSGSSVATHLMSPNDLSAMNSSVDHRLTMASVPAVAMKRPSREKRSALHEPICASISHGLLGEPAAAASPSTSMAADEPPPARSDAHERTRTLPPLLATQK